MTQLHKVRVTAFVTYEEVREIEITDAELAEFRAGRCADRIEQADTENEGTFISSSTVNVQGESWELATETEPTPAITAEELARQLADHFIQTGQMGGK